MNSKLDEALSGIEICRSLLVNSRVQVSFPIIHSLSALTCNYFIDNEICVRKLQRIKLNDTDSSLVKLYRLRFRLDEWRFFYNGEILSFTFHLNDISLNLTFLP